MTTQSWQTPNYQPTPPAPAPGPTPPRSRTPWVGVTAVGLVAGMVGGLATVPAILSIGAASTPAASGPVATGPVAPGPVAPASGAGSGWTSVASAVSPSVVSIDVTTPQGGDAGSGVIWDQAGHVVTNDHVVATAGAGATLTVTLKDQRTYAARVVGEDPTTDLAVLVIEQAPASLTPIEHGTDSVRVGDAVLAVGNPLGLSGTVTSGIVSAVDRPVATAAEAGGQPVVTNAIQTSAAVNPGNSGGALVDAAGHLVGINSAIASLGQTQAQSGNIGIGFAIPTGEVDLIVPQLIASGTAQHAFVGIATRDATIPGDGYQTSGAGVVDVVAGGPSAAVLRRGDVVTAVDGTAVNGTESLIGLIRGLPVGKAVQVTFVRGGQQSSAQVVLGAAPRQ